MNVTINSITSHCGGDHYNVNLTVGAQTRNIQLHKSDFQLEPADAEVALAMLMRHIAKTNNISTLAGLKAEMEGKTYKL